MTIQRPRQFPPLLLAFVISLAPGVARGGGTAPDPSTTDSPPVEPALSPAARRALADTIDTLRRRIRQPGAPDSLRLALARACQRTGTIEDRTQALALYDTIRRTYQDDPGYHRERAALFERCGQPSRARESLEELLKLTPHDVAARIEIARLRLRELTWHFDLDLAEPMLEVLRVAREDAPADRDALYLGALALELSMERPGRWSPAQARQGEAWLRSILDRHPDDTPARLLLAVHLLDQGRQDEAWQSFAAAVDSGPADQRAAFYSARWTLGAADPPPPERAGAAELARYDRLAWRRVDPTPLTDRNENQLILWKRLALADPLFGLPDRGVRGWDTPPGEAFVRYGEPVAHDFNPGEVWAGPNSTITLPKAGASGPPPDKPIRLIPTAWNWRYHFRGIDFDLRFEDRSLNGVYRADNTTGQTLALLRREAPVVFQEAAPGSIQQIYIASAGLRGAEGRVRQQIDVGVPFWRKGLDLRRPGKIRLEIVVRDSTRALVRQATHFAGPDDVVSPEPGLDVLLYSTSFDLKPGAYTVVAIVSDPERQIHGAASTLVTVRDYATPAGLTVSDLALAWRADSAAAGPATTRLGRAGVPNPMALAAADSTVDVYYETYGLAAPAGLARQQVRYTVLPRAYLLAFDRFVREKKAAPEDLLVMAEASRAKGQAGLTATNSLEVVFPVATVRVIDDRAPRATRVSLAGLEPGEYAFIVTVLDDATRATASAISLLRVMDDAQRAALRTYAARE